jgi:hypothetical protein
MVFEWWKSDTWSPSYGPKREAAVLLQAAKEEEENNSKNPNGNRFLSKIWHPAALYHKKQEISRKFRRKTVLSAIQAKQRRTITTMYITL